MYNTVKEMHIAIDLELQEINSNRQQSISPYYKDMALNYAVLQFIETRSNPKTNIKREGLEETTKRYDDLRELKRTFTSIAYKRADSKPFIILPSDYYKYISVGAEVHYNINVPTATSTNNIAYSVLPFPDDIDNIEKYKDLKVLKNNKVIFDINEYPNFPKVFNEDGKFMLINIILSKLKPNSELSTYWEQWDDVRESNSFIILSSSKFKLTYKDKEVVAKRYDRVYHSYPSLTTKTSPVDLNRSEDEFEILNNHYYQANKHLNPSGFIEGNSLYLYEGKDFIIREIKLLYFKKPELINHVTNQSCELSVNREIVDLAVQRLKSYIKDEGYQAMVNEVQIME